MDFAQLDLGQIVVLLIIAVAVGWLAGVITRGGGFGLVGDILIAIVGAFVGHYLFNLLDIEIGGGYLDLFVTATAGAVVVLLIVRLIRRI